MSAIAWPKQFANRRKSDTSGRRWSSRPTLHTPIHCLCPLCWPAAAREIKSSGRPRKPTSRPHGSRGLARVLEHIPLEGRDILAAAARYLLQHKLGINDAGVASTPSRAKRTTRWKRFLKKKLSGTWMPERKTHPQLNEASSSWAGVFSLTGGRQDPCQPAPSCRVRGPRWR